MFKRVFVASFMSLSLSAHGFDIGLGVSVQDSDKAVYIPIMLSNSVMLEGNILYSDRESEIDESSADSKSYEVGIGAFYKFSAREKLSPYFGGRVSYINAEFSSSTATTSSIFDNSFESNVDGYRVAPTLGIAFEVTKSFSIAAEAEWHYEDIDVEEDFSFTDREGSASSTGTETRLVFRYLF